MEHDENQKTTPFIPVIGRLDRLDRVLQLLEEKHSISLSGRDSCGAESNNECITLSSALEEVQHKGTLLERLNLLEKRVVELSLETDEGNTSKSSSSTVQVSETIDMKDSDFSIPSRKDENGVTVTAQEMQDPPIIQAHESASSGDGSVRETTAQHKSGGQKKKSRKKRLWLLRLGC